MDKCTAALLTAIGLTIIFFLSPITYAFHEGGAEEYCLGCHNIHRSAGSQGSDTGESSVAPKITLRGSDSSSTCLQCHASSGAVQSVLSNDGSRFTPGGDFYWLQKTFTWSEGGISYESEADSHGHNVVALDYGLHQDRRHSTAPGGGYLASSLACTSCHNPHATTMANGETGSIVSGLTIYGDGPFADTTSGNYRLLGGAGYQSSAQGSAMAFSHEPPIAVADSFSWTETDSRHPAYGSGMSEWCANCHSDFLNSSAGGAGGRHPAGKGAKLNGDIARNYNSYVKTGDLSGSQAQAYLALVPFEVGVSDVVFLDPSSSSGPGLGNANVMCLTCHRAHASAFENSGRWDFRAVFIAESHPRFGDGGVNGSDVVNSYYGRDITAEFGETQRQLCNKCHLKD
ncbi:MAG: cytochrome C [Deltaproteobacteria bacterium]|nr:cytochrome C [Deltaproteobacteria bacterium]